MREQLFRALAKESEAKLASAKSEEERARIRAAAAAARVEVAAARPHSASSASRLLPPPAPAPVEAAAPAPASSPRKHAISDDALDGFADSYALRGSYASKATASLHRSAKAKAYRAPSVTAAVAERAPPPPPPVVRLDPNARYATTYRPGGAALAELDAGLARGTIPAVYRDLVGDFGDRYAAPLAAPASGALAVGAATERAVLPPAGGPLHLRVALRSAPGADLARARLSVTLILDVSGSMQGRAIENAKAAAAALVKRLDRHDRFALVTFSNGARRVVAAGPIGPRRRAVLARIDGIGVEGGTNVSAGLDLAY